MIKNALKEYSINTSKGKIINCTQLNNNDWKDQNKTKHLYTKDRNKIPTH